MNEIMHYFKDVPSLQRVLLIAGGITFFWLLESAIPFFNFGYNKWKHASVNIFFTITTLIINFVFAFFIVVTSDWCVAKHFGLLQWVEMPLWVQLIVGSLLLDFVGAYCIHLIEHKIKWMWKFHMVHHADMHVDTTTANRHHPGESVFRAVFTAIAICITGAPIWMVMLYQTLSVALAQFNHANIKMNATIDKMLRLIFVTPNMHRVHHHYVRPATDSNYGNIFSLWDRIFGTYLYKPTNELIFGLDVLQTHDDENLKDQLGIPFDKKIKPGF